MTANAEQLSMHEYTKRDGMNFSWLKLFDVSPMEHHSNVPRIATKSMDSGVLNHLATLQPDLFESSVCTWPGGMTVTKPIRKTVNRTSKSCKEFAGLALLEGKTEASLGDLDKARSIARAVHAHPEAGAMLSEGQPELSIFWKHSTGVSSKSRIDWLRSNAIADLKTTKDHRPFWFGRQAHSLLYHAQSAMYQDAVEELTGCELPYYIIAVQSSPPHDVVVYKVPQDVLDSGRRLYRDWMIKLVQCRETGKWPGVNQGIEELLMPAYAYDEMDDAVVTFDGEVVK